MVSLLFTSLALTIALSSSASALQTTPSVEPKPASPLLVTEFRTSDSMIDYIQVYNDSSEAVYVSDWELVSIYEDGSDQFTYSLPAGYLPPEKYLVLSASTNITGEAVESLGDVEEFTVGDSFSLVSKADRFEHIPVPIATATESMRHHRYTSNAGNYTTNLSFSALADQNAPLFADQLYRPRDNFALQPIEILANSRNCSPAETDEACGDYVKFYNHTDETVDFAGVRLRIGYQGQSATNSNAIELSGAMAPNEYALFTTTAEGKPLNLTNSGGFVWLEDSYGVRTYEHAIIEYPDASNKKGTSWALGSDGEWNWATPHPGGENRIITPEPEPDKASEDGPKPCREDQFRNPETGRCKKIAAASSLKPCSADQYRSPETNRCRNIAAASNQLTPCKPDQYRSPETNRCRKITSSSSSLVPCKPNQTRNPATNRCRSNTALASSQLKPCKPGQERNPATNRCRKVTQAAKNPGFSVEEVAAARDTIASWWALGGVGSLAIGYAGWEWRSEVARALRKVREFLSSAGK